MKRIIALSFVVTFCISAIAQNSYMYNRQDKPLVDFGGRYKMSGWHFAPGITYQLTRFSNPEETIESGDQSYNLTVDPKGKLGAYLEIGRYNIFYQGGAVFNYMDYSLGYKMLRGKEEYTGDIEGEGKYSHNFLLGNFNINNVIQISDYMFIQNSIGANIDWRFITRTKYDGNPLANNVPPKIIGQVHYKFGVGFKVTEKLFIIPQIETPILNVHKFEKFKSTWGVFNSRYRPLILSVRFAWLRPIGKDDCPPVYRHDTDGDAQKNFNMR